jgi:hypothetical protein
MESRHTAKGKEVKNLKKFFYGFLAVMFAVSIVTVTMVYAGAIKAPAKGLTFQNKKGPVTFDHSIHTKAGVKCEKCHHMWKDKTKEPKGCKECHKAKKTGDVPKLYSMAHKSDHSCKGCHKAFKEAGKKAGPTKCSGCHKK